MCSRFLLSAACVLWCTGVSCQVGFPGDDDNSGGSPDYVQLDRAAVGMNIVSSLSDSTANATATIQRNGWPVRLQNGQSVSLNAQPLQETATPGQYSLSLPRSPAYLVEVYDPTLGSADTTVSAPADFAITEPAAGQNVSLANGFLLSWSAADPASTYVVTLTQTFNTLREKVLGPFPDDSGSRLITGEDLQDFVHGGSLDLRIQLTKRSQTAVNGFASGTARVELSQTVSVVPGP